MRNSLLLGLAMLFSIGIVFGQDRTVSGKVTSSEDGTGIPGVNIVVKGTTTGAVTDLDGIYTFTLPNDGTILVFTFIGMETQEVEIGNRAVIDVTMDADTQQLEEIIVTAYGESTKEAFTGSASVIDSEQLLSRNVTSPIQAIEGNATGVQFI